MARHTNPNSVDTLGWTKEQMAERITDQITVPGLSRASTVYMFQCLRAQELRDILAALKQ